MSIINRSDYDCLAIIVPSITKHPNSLIKFFLNQRNSTSLSFVSEFTNLQELSLSFSYHIEEDFKALQFVAFSQLQILKFDRFCPKHEYFNEFLGINGKDLKEIYLRYGGNLSNLAIAKHCPNLKSLYTRFVADKVETLKLILNSCQQLESIKVSCDYGYLNESELLKVITKYSPKKFQELKIYWPVDSFYLQTEIFLEELEPIFINWANRVPQKSLSLIINH